MTDGSREKGPAVEVARAARSWANRALARRARSAHEIRDGLSRRGYPSGIVDEVVDSLNRSGLLDDARFAARWVAVRSETKNIGPLRLARELRRMGVPPDAIRSALAEGIDAETEARLARRAAARKMRMDGRRGPKATAALMRHLRSRGFSTEAIRGAIGRGEEEE